MTPVELITLNSTNSLYNGAAASTALAILTLGLWGPCHAAEDYAALLTEASQSLDQFDGSDWLFTETVATSEGTFVGRHDGRLDEGQRWNLVSVDAREPTDEEREEYLSEKERDSDEDDDSIADMVDIESLALIEETDSRWLFEFSPLGGDDEDSDFLEHVNGELEIRKENVHISSIRLHSSKPFKPHFSVKIREFLTHLQFGPIGTMQQIAPVQIKVKIKARALLVKGIEEESLVTYSDYEFVGELDGE